jgi:hypothetical protein
MKGKMLWIVLAILIALVIVIVAVQRRPEETAVQNTAPANSAIGQNQPPPAAPQVRTDSHIPAHYNVAPALTELGPVLDPAQFTGKAREAYEAVKAATVTIAQMPCYCHCDRGMGHKSLHSCFEDDHAAHCAVCVDEALMAYRLQKEGMSAPEIRERIIARFGT